MTKNFLYSNVLLMAAIVPSVALANFSISPVKLYVKPDEKVGAITITNSGDTDTNFQLKLYSWNKEKGKDKMENTSDLIITPLMFNIKPGKSQMVRVGLKNNVRGATEKAYRLFIKELPAKKNIKGSAVQMGTTFNVPIFIEPNVHSDGKVDCDLDHGDQHVNIKCENSHNQHAVISSVHLADEQDQKTEHPIGKYVFPGETIEHSVEKPANNTNPVSGTVNIIHKSTNTAVGETPKERQAK